MFLLPPLLYNHEMDTWFIKRGGDRVEAARDRGGFDAERADGVQVKERRILFSSRHHKQPSNPSRAIVATERGYIRWLFTAAKRHRSERGFFIWRDAPRLEKLKSRAGIFLWGLGWCWGAWLGWGWGAERVPVSPRSKGKIAQEMWA